MGGCRAVISLPHCHGENAVSLVPRRLLKTRPALFCKHRNIDPYGTEGNASFTAEIPAEFFVTVGFLSAYHVIDMKRKDISGSEHFRHHDKKQRRIRPAGKTDDSCFSPFEHPVVLHRRGELSGCGADHGSSRSESDVNFVNAPNQPILTFAVLP